ncbi:MAG: DUF1294 domain-containing protein [Methanoregula sp.]|jgi:uncharacterized membrane protein YsdA (DUF1294 family)
MAVPGFWLLLVAYILVNGAVFLYFACDKIKAKKNAWRTPENRLVFFAFLGPFGAWGGMHMFRHKTRKIKFYLVPLFAVLHLTFLIGVFMYILK